MKQFFSLLCALFVFLGNTSAQTETFDITTYTLLNGWAKEKSETAIQFSKEDAAKGTYCIITLFKAVSGTASAKENFDLAWESIVKEMVTVSAPPEMQPPATEDGWEAQSGYAPFEKDGNKGIAMLVTSSGFEKMVNIVILINTADYEKEMTGFLESVSYKKMKSPTIVEEKNIQQTPVTNNNEAAILGTWGVSWRKKEGTDKWGNLLSSKNKTLEKITYQFSKQYFSGMQEWNLVLEANQETQRDGRLSANTTFTTAWLYTTPCKDCLIKLPDL